MLCSVGYHLFACHRSEKTSRRWLSLDYAGISVGILGCYVPGIFYAFYCDAVSFNAADGAELRQRPTVPRDDPTLRVSWNPNILSSVSTPDSTFAPVSQFWCQVYLLTVLSLILAVFCAQVHPRYLSNDWRHIRMSLFCCVAGISVIPACHWVWLNGGFTSDVVQVSPQTRLSNRACP